MLVVTQPFASYQRGDRITDAGLIATILATEEARNVIVVGTPATPPPVLAQRTLLELLADIADNGGAVLQPQLIDVLPDANGKPPTGYEWLPGVSAQHNYGCALTDYAQAGLFNPIPCQTGFANSSWFAGQDHLQVNAVRSETNATFGLTIPTPVDALEVVLVGAQILSDSSAFISYKIQQPDGNWYLNTCIAHDDGTVTNAASQQLMHPGFLAVPQAVATIGAYFVQSFFEIGYLLVDANTGVQTLDPGPATHGVLVASDANGIYVQRGGDPVLLYVPLTISTVAGVPTLAEGENVVVMPIPGGTAGNLTSPYLPIGATHIPNGPFVLCTRAGFFEVNTAVANGYASVSVRQTAGVHPLTSLGMHGTDDDVKCMRFDGVNGTLHTLSASSEVVFDYMTLKSLFVRKARLIA